MLRVLGQLAIYGDRSCVERIASAARIPNASLEPVGRKRRIPETDHWCYASPWFRFRLESLDNEVSDFLAAHQSLAGALSASGAGLRFAMLTMCPVERSSEEAFAFLLSNRTLDQLATLHLALEVSPAELMPDAPYWKDATVSAND